MATLFGEKKFYESLDTYIPGFDVLYFIRC